MGVKGLISCLVTLTMVSGWHLTAANFQYVITEYLTKINMWCFILKKLSGRGVKKRQNCLVFECLTCWISWKSEPYPPLLVPKPKGLSPPRKKFFRISSGSMPWPKGFPPPYGLPPRRDHFNHQGQYFPLLHLTLGDKIAKWNFQAFNCKRAAN